MDTIRKEIGVIRGLDRKKRRTGIAEWS